MPLNEALLNNSIKTCNNKKASRQMSQFFESLDIKNEKFKDLVF
jgi:hypothetical protein